MQTVHYITWSGMAFQDHTVIFLGHELKPAFIKLGNILHWRNQCFSLLIFVIFWPGGRGLPPTSNCRSCRQFHKDVGSSFSPAATSRRSWVEKRIKTESLKLGGDESHEFPHLDLMWLNSVISHDVPLVVHHVHHGFDLRPLFGLICLHPSSPALKTLRTCKLESTST